MSENHEVQVGRRRSPEEINRLVDEFEASGARVSDFCRNHDLAKSIMWRHLKRRRLGKVEPTKDPTEGPRLMAVALRGANLDRQTPRGSALEVVLLGGRRIEVRPDFDAGTLERLLKVLERG